MDVHSKFPNEAKNFTLAHAEATEEKKKSAPIAGFVSTSVLTSSDGLFGDNVEEKRIEDCADQTDPNGLVDDGRTLFERLQEQKSQKDAEWKAKNNPFAPPKALDDEEVEFLEVVQRERLSKDQLLQKQISDSVAFFARAQEEKQAKTLPKKATSSIKLVKKQVNSTKDKIDEQAQPVVIIKRKQSSSDAATATDIKKVKKKKKKQKISLVAYNSGDESE